MATIEPFGHRSCGQVDRDRERDQDEGIHVEVIARLVADLAREAGGEEREVMNPWQEQQLVRRRSALKDEHRGEGDEHDHRHHRPAGEEPGQTRWAGG
jgi:hypothetical protein